MQIYTHTLPGGAQLIGYLRDRTVEMPAFNTRPAILILPGGGYAWCSRRESDPVAMQFLQAGYNVFTLYYTCRSDETVPALRWQPLIDAAGAILHIRRNAEQFGTDPAKIAICGFSAGGHLAASTAILWDAEPVQTALGIHGTEARPDAVVLGYPVIIEDACVITTTGDSGSTNTDNVFFGDFFEYKWNFAQDIEVAQDTSVGFRTGSVCYRAMCLADGKLADENAIVRYERAAS